MTRLEDIKRRWEGESKDITWLVERVEKATGLEEALKQAKIEIPRLLDCLAKIGPHESRLIDSYSLPIVNKALAEWEKGK